MAVRQITIHDVARAAGVSIGTVSKALNSQGQLTDGTRAKVRHAAATLGFRPNDLAQSLHRGRSFTVGLISNDRFGRFSLPILEGIEDALDPARVAVFVCKPTDDPEHERRHIASLLAKRVDGIIVTSRRTDSRPPIDLEGAAIPVVYAYSQVERPDAICVLPDDFGGGELAGRHLASLGRSIVAHVTGPERFLAVQERKNGLITGLSEAGCTVDASLILYGEWSERFGYEAVGQLLDSSRPFDAVFCGSDQIARGVSDGLRDRGVRVPHDVAVIGFDNWEIIAAATRPALTTVDPDLSTLGRTAAQRLLGMIEASATVEPKIERIACKMVVRRSCGAAHD